MFQQGLFNIDPTATTPEQVERNRRLFAAMMKPGSVRYAGEGAMKGLAAAIGGFGVGRENKRFEAGRSSFMDALMGRLGGDVTPSTRGEPSGGYIGGGGGYAEPEPLNQGFGATEDMMMGEALSFNQPAPEGVPGVQPFGEGADAMRMPNQFEPLPIDGAIDGVDPNLVDMTSQAWGYVLPGGSLDVSTGVSSHSPVNHAPGHAIDYRVRRPDGSVVAANDPEMLQAAQIGRALGVNGIGFGPGYMGGELTHWDVSANGPRTWGDDDGTASDRLGAGAPEVASQIAAATGRPVEDVLAELGINPGDPRELAFGPTAERDLMGPQMASLMQGQAVSPTVPAPSEFASVADAEARRAGVDPNLFRALVTQESAWNPSAQSPVGAFGLSQAMPDTARDPGFGVSPMRDPNDPQEQLRFGADYLSAMMGRYDGDVTRALVAYNAGPGVADRWDGDMASLPRETQGYVANITGMTGGLQTTASARGPQRPPDTRTAQANTATDAQPGLQGASLDQLYELAMNPWATDAERAVIMSMIDQQQQASDPMRQLQMQRLQMQIEQMQNPQADQTALMQNVEWLMSQGVPFEDALQQAQSGQTINVDTGGGTNFGQDFFEDRYATIQTQAGSAAQTLGLYDMAESALSSLGDGTGFGAEAQQAFRRIGSRLGMDVDDDALAGGELLTAVTNRMALQMRNPDSGMGMPGAVSDRDLAFLRDAQVGIDRSPEGNRRMLRAFRAMEQRKIEIAEMADRYIQQNGRLDTGFNQMVREYAQANPMFSPEMFNDIPAGGNTGGTGGNEGSRIDPAAPQTPGASGGNIPTVTTQTEYDALLPGSAYRDPDGNVRIKPGGPSDG